MVTWVLSSSQLASLSLAFAGTIPTAKSQNYVADIPFILNLVEYLLDVRFP
jgi:hypothetical protein